MTKALALAFAVVLACPAFAGEGETVQLKVVVDGMSCPTGCAPKVVKALAAVEGAQNVKLEDFEKGLFSLSTKSVLKADALQKSLGDYKVKKLEATVTGVISIKDKEIVLTSASGQKLGLSVAAPKACCSDDKAPKVAAKKDDCDTCPTAAAALKTKFEALAKDGNQVKVTGVVGSCCELSLTVNAIDEVKKATN